MLQPGRLASCLFLMTLAVQALGQETSSFIVGPQTDLSEHYHTMAWLQDPTGRLTVDDVNRAPGRFIPAAARMINPGLSGATIWVHQPITNATDADLHLVVSMNRFLVASAAVYVVHEGGQTQTLLENGSEAFRDAFQRYGTLAAGLTVAPDKRADVYVQYRGANWSGMYMTLHRAEAFFNTRALNDAVFFVLLGGILTLVLYGAISFTFLGAQVVLLYCLGQLAFFGFFAHLSGYTTVYVWPQAPEFGRLFSSLSVLTYVLAMTQFARVFFETRERLPRLDRVFVIVLGGGMMALAVGALDMASAAFQSQLPLYITYAAMAVTWSILPGLAIYATVKWEIYYWPLVIAWTGMATFILFMVSMLVAGVAFVPVTGKPSVAVAVFFEALFFALGIALRIRAIRTKALATERRLAKSLRSELDALHRAQRLSEERQWAISDLAEKGRLLLAAGHDTRQVLGALRGYAAAMRNGISEQDTRDLADHLDDAATYLNDVLTTAVDGSHSGGITDSSLAVDTMTVGELLRPLSMAYGHQAAEKGIELIVRDGGQRVAVDRVLLLRVLGNFVSNAIKYTASGKVLVACRPAAGMLRLQVFDTGQGIEPQALSQLLNPEAGAFRTGTIGAQGLGAGMGITHRLAARLGGRIHAESTPGRGALFELLLPRPPPLERATGRSWLLLDGDAHLLIRGVPLPDSTAAETPTAGQLAVVDEHYRGEFRGRELAVTLQERGCTVVLTSYDRSAETRTALMNCADMVVYKPVSAEALAFVAWSTALDAGKKTVSHPPLSE